MKVVVVFLALCSVVAPLAQGIVNFSNTPSAVGGDGAPVSDVNGIRIAGEVARAQLFGGPDIHTLQATGEALTFRTGSGAGFFTGGTNTVREIQGVLPGQTAAIRIMVWDADYDSWEAAAEAGAPWTSSSDLYVKTGNRDFLGPPPNLIGLQPFGMMLPTSTLHFGTTSGLSLIIQWNWHIQEHLEWSTNLPPNAVWGVVTNSPITVAGTFSVLLDTTSGNRFFRLRFQ